MALQLGFPSGLDALHNGYTGVEALGHCFDHLGRVKDAFLSDEVVATLVLLLDVIFSGLRTQPPPFVVRYLHNFTRQHVGLFLFQVFAELL